MTDWLRRGAAAATLAGERGALWAAGTLASLVYIGWLPLVVVLAPPDGNDLEYFGVQLVTSGSYPANVIALCVAAVAGFVLLMLAATTAEILISAQLRRRHAREASRSALGGVAVLLLATLPVIIAISVLVPRITSVAPGVYISPDVDTPVLQRLAEAVAPFLVGVGVAILAGQVFGGLALRLVIADEGRDTSRAIARTLSRLVRGPYGPVGVALVGWLKDLLLLVGSYALLHALWSPIAERLSAGPLMRPEVLLLLVGFVGVWLALLVAGGALHVFVSAWWFAELSGIPARTEAPMPGGRPDALGGHGR